MSRTLLIKWQPRRDEACRACMHDIIVVTSMPESAVAGDGVYSSSVPNQP